MRRLTVLSLSLALVALACATTESARTPDAEPLRVALFGWIPNAADDKFAALEAHIESTYAKRTDRTVDVEFRFDEFYDPVGLYRLFDSFDVVEMDAVMLGLAVDEEFVIAWPKVPKRNWHPAAVRASTVEATEYGIPHWLCSFFVFTRSDTVARQTSLDGLVSSVAALGSAEPDISGVLDGSWDSITMYLSGWLDQGNASMDDALSEPPHSDVLKGFSKLGAGCVEGGESPCTNYGYSAAACLETGLFDEAYCDSTSVDPPTKRFALGEVDTLVGYSERLHYVLRSAPAGARSSIRVVGMPLGSDRKLAVFVDVLALSARCKTDSCKDAAVQFAELYTDPALVEYTLVSGDAGTSGIPRYLLPADQDVYARPGIVGDAFYMQLKSAVDGATAYTNDPRIYHYKELYKDQVKDAFKR